MKRIFTILLALFLCTNAFSQILKKDLKDFLDKEISINTTRCFNGDEVYDEPTNCCENHNDYDVKYPVFCSKVLDVRDVVNSKYILNTEYYDNYGKHKTCKANWCILVYDPWYETIYVIQSLIEDFSCSPLLPEHYKGLHLLNNIEKDYYNIYRDSYKNIKIEKQIYVNENYNDIADKYEVRYVCTTPAEEQKRILNDKEMIDRLHELLNDWKESVCNYPTNDKIKKGEIINNVGVSEEVSGYKYIKRIVCINRCAEGIYFDSHYRHCFLVP